MSASSDSTEINAHELDVMVSSLDQFGLFELFFGIGLRLVDGDFHHTVDAVLGVRYPVRPQRSFHPSSSPLASL